MIAAACASMIWSASSIEWTTTGASTTPHDLLEEHNERQGGAGAVGEEAMNAVQLKKNVSQDLHLRPHPLIAQYFPRTIAVFAGGGDPMVARRLAKTDYV